MIRPPIIFMDNFLWIIYLLERILILNFINNTPGQLSIFLYRRRWDLAVELC